MDRITHFDTLNKILYGTEILSKELRETLYNSHKIHPNRYQALHDFWSEHDFKNGLEIGRSFGYSAVAFTTFYPKAKLDSIDIIDRPENLELFESMGVSDRINIIVGDSTKIPVNDNDHEKYDYILIDGDHTYEGAKADFERILLHAIGDESYIVIDDLHHVWGENTRSVAHLWEEIVEFFPKARKICRDMGVILIDLPEVKKDV